MNPYTILGRLRLMANLDDDDAVKAFPLCQAALEQLLARLKPGCGREDPRLVQAGAAMALCMLLAREATSGGEEFSSFKAGDISITKQDHKSQNDRLAKAERMKAEALEDIRELLRDTGFFAHSAPFRKPDGQRHVHTRIPVKKEDA